MKKLDRAWKKLSSVLWAGGQGRGVMPRFNRVFMTLPALWLQSAQSRRAPPPTPGHPTDPRLLIVHLVGSRAIRTQEAQTKFCIPPAPPPFPIQSIRPICPPPCFLSCWKMGPNCRWISLRHETGWCDVAFTSFHSHLERRKAVAMLPWFSKSSLILHSCCGRHCSEGRWSPHCVR